MEAPKSESPVVHVYGPRFPNEAIEVFGNKRGLERVINALIDAINVGVGGGEVFANDGARSPLRAACITMHGRSEDWTRSGSPYWDLSDPYVAQIVRLAEENDRLKQTIATLERERERRNDGQPKSLTTLDGDTPFTWR